MVVVPESNVTDWPGNDRGIGCKLLVKKGIKNRSARDRTRAKPLSAVSDGYAPIRANAKLRKNA